MTDTPVTLTVTTTPRPLGWLNNADLAGLLQGPLVLLRELPEYDHGVQFVPVYLRQPAAVDPNTPTRHTALGVLPVDVNTIDRLDITITHLQSTVDRLQRRISDLENTHAEAARAVSSNSYETRQKAAEALRTIAQDLCPRDEGHDDFNDSEF